MADVSKIAWTRSTFNPWIGCTMLKALVEARELVSGWADYADEYFKTKHRLTDDLAMLDAAINKARSNHG